MLLISLAVFGDVVRVAPISKRQAWNFWFGDFDPSEKLFNRYSYSLAVSRLLKTGQIEKIVENGKARIKITPFGLKVLSLKLDLKKFSRRAWDKKWRMIVFDISEKSKKHRDGLRRKLKSLSFGMMQKSVWITPFPIENELREYFSHWHIKGEIIVSQSKILVGDQRELCARIWRISRLKRKYERLIKYWGKVKKEHRNRKLAIKFQRIFFDLIAKDPYLPQELLPKPWVGDTAESIYRSEVLKYVAK